MLADLSFLHSSKNLLAFSHGVDSTALFYLLLERNVPFDLAMVDYGMRPEAAEEIAAAKALARRHGKRLHLANAPQFDGDFECRARRWRYEYFESLIEEFGYDTLLTAHQLDDRLEWLMMRLMRGAGALELAGMEAESLRRTPGGKAYRLLRPLLERSREEIEAYLLERGVEYFRDASNFWGANERSRLRPLLSSMMQEHARGIRRSFEYLERDREAIRSLWETLHAQTELRILHLKTPSVASRAADAALKELGYLLSAAERRRIDGGKSLVAGRHWAIERSGELLAIAPYLQGVTLPKAFREQCRKLRIPPKIRPYLFREGIDPESLQRSIDRREKTPPGDSS